MTAPVRILRRYRPACDLRRDPTKRGRCGLVWCREPAAYVWTDRAGRHRHRCRGHACP